MSTEGMRYFQTLDDEELTAVLLAWRADRPGLGTLALLPEAEHDGMARVQSLCAAQGVPVAGAVFPALIEHERFATSGAWLLRLDEMPFAALYPGLGSDSRALAAAADALARDLAPHLGSVRDATLLLLFDAMFPSVGSLLDEIYLRLANRVHYMGANAGSETFKPIPCLFDGARTAQGGFLAVLLSPHRGAVLDHGYPVPERMITATSTEGNRILQIDWRPAFEVYQELCKAQYGVQIDRESFYRYGVHFPFGIVRANGVVLVRIPVALEEDGSLFCVGEVPANSVLALLQAPAVDSVQTLETVVGGLAALAPLDASELLLFYCAGRRLHLGLEAASLELREAARRSRARMAGALSLGEIGGTTRWDYPLFHNATLVASHWGGA